MPNEIYLDNGTTTKPSTNVINAMMPFYNKLWGTLCTPHSKSNDLLPSLTQSYKTIYRLLEASDDDTFIFTSSGAEAVNQVILSTYFTTAHQSGKNQVITSAIDEAPALMAISRLEQLSCTGRMVEPNEKGFVPLEAILDAISPRTALVSLSWANGLTGVINPIIEISHALKSRGIPFHVDVSHILGKITWQPEELHAAFITFNGDHIHAPPGTGGLLVKKGHQLAPLILGGIEQFGMRAGPLNVAGAIALGTAAQEALESRDLMALEVARLRNKLEKGLKQEIPETVILFEDQERLPNVCAAAFPGVVNEALLYFLNKKNIYACIGGGAFQQLSLIARACHIPKHLAFGAISFNLSQETTDEDIDRTIDAIAEIVKKLRNAAGSLFKNL